MVFLITSVVVFITSAVVFISVDVIFITSAVVFITSAVVDIEFWFGQPWTEDQKACDKGVVVFQDANMVTEVCLRRLPVL